MQLADYVIMQADAERLLFRHSPGEGATLQYRGGLMALGWLGEGLIVEVLGAALIACVGFISGKYLERKRQVGKFYVAIAPVLKVLSKVASAERIPAIQVQRIVREISLSFSRAYLGGPDRLPLRKDLYRATGTEKSCSICDDSVAITNDACSHCRLDCCVWDFQKVNTNTSELPEAR
jgi:hypothetical protein